MKFIQFNLSLFFRCHLMAFKLNSYYQYSYFISVFLFISIFSSLIIRSSWIDESMITSNSPHIFLLIFFTVFYMMKLILDLLTWSIQSLKIIPQFIQWIQQDIKNIQFIILCYYFQIFIFSLLSTWILYTLFIKLNIYAQNLPIYVGSIGILSSFLWIYKYPLHTFTLQNIPDKSMYVYCLWILFFISYIFIFPFCLFKLMNNDILLQWRESFESYSVKYAMNWMNPPEDIEIDNPTSFKVRNVNTSVNITIPIPTPLDVEIEHINTSVNIIPMQVPNFQTSNGIHVTMLIDALKWIEYRDKVDYPNTIFTWRISFKEIKNMIFNYTDCQFLSLRQKELIYYYLIRLTKFISTDHVRYINYERKQTLLNLLHQPMIQTQNKISNTSLLTLLHLKDIYLYWNYFVDWHIQHHPNRTHIHLDHIKSALDQFNLWQLSFWERKFVLESFKDHFYSNREWFFNGILKENILQCIREYQEQRLKNPLQWRYYKPNIALLLNEEKPPFKEIPLSWIMI